MKQQKPVTDEEPDHNGADGITSNEYAKAFKDNAKENFYETSQKLIDLGLAVCSNCGMLMNMDYKWCKKCQKHSAIFKQKPNP